MNSNIENIDSHAVLRKKLLNFIRPQENDTCGVHDPLGVRLFNRLRLGLIHLRAHQFLINFTDVLNLLCSSSLETEDGEHYFLRCQNNFSPCIIHTYELNNINTPIASLIPRDLFRDVTNSSLKELIARY